MNYSIPHTDDSLAALLNFDLDGTDNKVATESASDVDTTISVNSLTKRPLTNNPIFQIGVVSAGVGGLFLGLAMMAGNVTLPGGKKPPEQPTASKSAFSENTMPADSNGEIKTGLAFGQEADDLAALSDLSNSAEGESATDSTNDTTTNASSASRSPTRYLAGYSTSSPGRPVVAAPAQVPASRVVSSPVRYTAPPPSPVRPAVSAVVRSTTPAAPSVTATPESSKPDQNSIPSQPATASSTVAEAEETAAIDQTPQPPTASAPSASNLTLASGTTATAVVENSILVAGDIPLKNQVRLTAPLTTARGNIALPTGTILIAEAVESTQGTAYLHITGALLEGAEHPFPVEAMVALGAAGQLQSNNSDPSRDSGLDVEQAILTGAIAGLDIDSDDVLGGIALDILGQVTERNETRRQDSLQQATSWVIPAQTALTVHVNSPITVPISSADTLPSAPLESTDSIATPIPATPESSVPTAALLTSEVSAVDATDSVATVVEEEPSNTASLVASAGEPDSLVGIGSVPSSSATVVLRPETGNLISFLQRDETIINAWVSNEAMVKLTFDQPLESGESAVIRTYLKQNTTAKTACLDVITQSPSGARHWRRFELHRG